MKVIPSKAVLCALFALACFFASATAWGQLATAGIYGEVTDQQGGAVAGAKVTITNDATGLTRQTETDSSGRYQFLALPPGNYTMRFEMTGFRTAVRDKLELLVHTMSKLNVVLEVGPVKETVVVSEAVIPLNTHDASMGNVLTEIPRYPLEARSIVALLSLQPGATYVPTGASGDMRNGSISGSRSDQSNITLDGVDINDPQNQTEAYTPSLRVTAESIQEFRVTTSNYDALEGRSSGGQVAMITKSGSKDFHGSAYWFHRNTVFSSNEYFNKFGQRDLPSGPINKQPPLRKHLFGGAAGGPIIKDRLFIYGNFEAFRMLYAPQAIRSVPSASFRDGVLIYQCRNRAGNPACPTTATTVTGLSGSVYNVPPGFFGASPAQLAAIDPIGIGPDPAVTSYLRGYPLPNDPGRDGRTVGGTSFGNIMGFRFAANTFNRFNTAITKIDYKVDQAGNHTLFLRGNYQHDRILGDSQFPGQPPSSAALIQPKGFAVGYNAVLNPRLVNTFRWGWTRFQSQTAGLQNSSVSTLRFLSSFEAVTSTLGRTFTTNNLVDDVSYTRGAHTLQFGGNIRFSRIPRFTNAPSFHNSVANGSWLTGVGRRYMPGRTTCNTPGCTQVPAVATAATAVWADSSIDIWGILSQTNARFNYEKDGSLLPIGTPIRREYASNEFEFYIQDSWQIRRGLTLNFGVRYAIFSPPWEVTGRQVAPNPSFGDWFEMRRRGMLAGIPSNQQPRISFDLAGPANGRKGFYPYDWNNWAPRVSAAWTPRFSSGILGRLTGNGKTVLRGGYSLVYDRIGQALATSFDASGSFGLGTILVTPFGSLTESTAPRFTGFRTVPSAPFLPPAPKGGFPSSPAFGLFAITNSIDDTNTTPYAHMINFSIGRELPGKITFEAAYVGRRGRKLLSKRDLAMPLDLVDPVSKVDYFTAASQLAALAEVGDPIGFSVGTPVANVPTIPYWENMYPGMVGNPLCDVQGLGAAAYNTATKAVYDLYLCVAPDYTTALQFLDQGPSFDGFTLNPGLCESNGSCSRFGSYAYFNDQYSSLAGQSTIGRSEYHALQITARKRMSQGLQFDFNYTFSKSLDFSSEVERGSNFSDFFGGGYSEFVVNSWNPELWYAPSTFDMRHQMNFNWIYQLPVGRDRWLAKDVPGWLNQIIGNWDVSGLWRWQSGLPFNVINCRSCWPTNWNLQGNAGLFGASPPTGTTKNVAALKGRPSPFIDPTTAINAFRRSRPGEVGLRNTLRGDGYFTIDLGVIKTWQLAERHRLMFRWETFNLTNTPKFDTGTLSATPDITASFGRYNSTLAVCDGAAGRCMQFALRYEF